MKRRNVRFSSEAEDDLSRIVGWIEERASLSVAIGYATRLHAYCQRLVLASERGTTRDDITPGLRVIGFERRVSIAFVVDGDEVVILRLFYGGRDWENDLL